MKKYILLIFTLLFLTTAFSQQKSAPFKGGEWLRYKMSYSGFLRAGTAILEVEETKLNGKKVFHTKGTGWTSGMIKWFFEVDDIYESQPSKTFSGVDVIFSHPMPIGFSQNELVEEFLYLVSDYCCICVQNCQ